eukprot:4126494-Amphidinium_carterae.1
MEEVPASYRLSRFTGWHTKLQTDDAVKSYFRVQLIDATVMLCFVGCFQEDLLCNGLDDACIRFCYVHNATDAFGKQLQGQEDSPQE